MTSCAKCSDSEPLKLLSTCNDRAALRRGLPGRPGGRRRALLLVHHISQGPQRCGSMQAQPSELTGLAPGLEGGNWGRFAKAARLLGPHFERSCKLPSIVVLGYEHEGKSSLVEGLTGQRIFPRASSRSTTTATTRPLRVTLEPSTSAQPAFTVDGKNFSGPWAEQEAADEVKRCAPPGIEHLSTKELHITITQVRKYLGHAAQRIPH